MIPTRSTPAHSSFAALGDCVDNRMLDAELTHFAACPHILPWIGCRYVTTRGRIFRQKRSPNDKFTVRRGDQSANTFALAWPILRAAHNPPVPFSLLPSSGFAHSSLLLNAFVMDVEDVEKVPARSDFGDHRRGSQFDPTNDAIVTEDVNKLKRNLHGRHMQMIAIGRFLSSFDSNRSELTRSVQAVLSVQVSSSVRVALCAAVALALWLVLGRISSDPPPQSWPNMG
jgi:hypothetical protein